MARKGYAHIEIVVTFLVVNFFRFLVMVRNPLERFWRKLVEILPTGLPELSKPSGTLENLRKSKCFRTEICQKFQKNNDY